MDAVVTRVFNNFMYIKLFRVRNDLYKNCSLNSSYSSLIYTIYIIIKDYFFI
nr:MAG TPA: hypothetical protein [Caudoviricetes sp.]